MITIKDASHTFSKGTANATSALRQVNLHLNKGDFVVVLGANGSGKSTLSIRCHLQMSGNIEEKNACDF